MRELEYPFDGGELLKKKRQLRKILLGEPAARIKKKIAVLGGSTTHDIVKMLELFLLNQGICPEFYESEYNRYYEDAVFPNEKLAAFGPDIVYIHTTFRNITEGMFPKVTDSEKAIEEKLSQTYYHFQQAWEGLRKQYHCLIIQNNFEKLPYRLLGNMDIWDQRGRGWFLEQLNLRFSQYAQEHEDFLIQDIGWLAAEYGLSKWSDPVYWNMYKYSPAVPAIPELAFNLSNIIKAVYGKSKKAMALDLDNTLWGGVVGDDGPENIEIGQETGMAQIYLEFQNYLKEHQERGVLLTVNSKNEESNALAGLKRPDSALKPEDFAAIRANWEPKDKNLRQLAGELNLGLDAFVFVDDNPAERYRVSVQLPEVSVPEMTEGQEPEPEKYIRILDRSGFFEPIQLSGDDLKRNSMYQANTRRKQLETACENYEDYLHSLEMKGEIGPFSPVYMQRIAQLTNKSNQFNLTTKRFDQAELEACVADGNYLTLYGKLTDKFGDNGVVSVVMGKQEKDVLHLELWLMSCRVLKRDMEKAMLDQTVMEAKRRNIDWLIGYYYPTAKNEMVRYFYQDMGFSLVREEADGSSVWKLNTESYKKQNRVIAVNKCD